LKFSWLGSAAGTLEMPRQAIKTSTASPSKIKPRPDLAGAEFFRRAGSRDGPKNDGHGTYPIRETIAHDSRRSWQQLGSEPYLEGPKNALWVPIRKMPAISMVLPVERKPAGQKT